MTLALKFVTTYIIDLMVREIMDLIRSVDLGVLVLGFISPPGYFQESVWISEEVFHFSPCSFEHSLSNRLGYMAIVRVQVDDST